jgi:hypothetical protein
MIQSRPSTLLYSSVLVHSSELSVILVNSLYSHCIPILLKLLNSQFQFSNPTKSKSKSHCDWRSDNQQILMSSPTWGHLTRYLLLFDSYGLVFLEHPLWREDGLSFVYAAGPRQLSLSRVRVPWDLWQYFIISDLRLSFSSPPTTRRVTVEVFETSSTRMN